MKKQLPNMKLEHFTGELDVYNPKYIKKTLPVFNYMFLDEAGAYEDILPVLMPIGTIFENEYGVYKVTQYVNRVEEIFCIECDRLTIHPTLSDNFTLG